MLLLSDDPCCQIPSKPGFSSGGGVDWGEGLGGVGGVIIDRIESPHRLFKMDPDEKSPLNGQNVKSSAL